MFKTDFLLIKKQQLPVKYSLSIFTINGWTFICIWAAFFLRSHPTPALDFSFLSCQFLPYSFYSIQSVGLFFSSTRTLSKIWLQKNLQYIKKIPLALDFSYLSYKLLAYSFHSIQSVRRLFLSTYTLLKIWLQKNI